MKLSRESQNALLALAYLAGRPEGTILQAAELADAIDVSPTFLAKILLKLTRQRVVASHRGRQRGYSLMRPAGQISVREAVEAVEGNDLFQRCVFWSNQCSDVNPCPLHPVWKTVRPMVSELMAHISIEELASGRELPGLKVASGGPR